MLCVFLASGAPHLNINLQMNYWPSLSCNLKECQEPLFDYISSLSINGKKTAQVRPFPLIFNSNYETLSVHSDTCTSYDPES